LHFLAKNAPQLQTLRVSHRRHYREEGLWVQSYANTLDRGLLMRAATLRHLHLYFYASGDWEFNRYIGPDQRLTCLPQLCHLETLQIQLLTLFGTRSAISSSDIGNMFPNSLAELTLDDEWDDGECDDGEWDNDVIEDRIRLTEAYEETIMEMLMRLCEAALAERLPHLRRVHYVSDYWPQRRQKYFPAEKPFDEIQAMFSKRGIEFYAGEKLPMHA
jgi:hypothetical protein